MSVKDNGDWDWDLVNRLTPGRVLSPEEDRKMTAQMEANAKEEVRKEEANGRKFKPGEGWVDMTEREKDEKYWGGIKKRNDSLYASTASASNSADMTQLNNGITDFLSTLLSSLKNFFSNPEAIGGLADKFVKAGGSVKAWLNIDEFNGDTTDPDRRLIKSTKMGFEAGVPNTNQSAYNFSLDMPGLPEGVSSKRAPSYPTGHLPSPEGRKSGLEQGKDQSVIL